MEQAHKLPFELQATEVVLLFCRRHWAFLASQMAKVVLFAVVPVVVLLTIVSLTAGLGGRPGQVAWIVSAVWLVAWAVKGYFAWYRYNHDIWVVTNQRVIDSIKRHWFHHGMASADLVDVEDIAVKREGLFATAFKFGDLHLQTAGERPNFVLSGIPQPGTVLALIDSQRDIARRELGRLTSRD
jgi:hypothetical protein